jgi:hypothetical protein
MAKKNSATAPCAVAHQEPGAPTPHDDERVAASKSKEAVVDEIHRLHGKCLNAARATVETAVRIGELLTELKRTCGRGNWETFAKERLPFSKRTVQNYMGLHKNREKLKSANFADLLLTDAYKAGAKMPEARANDQIPPGSQPPSVITTDGQAGDEEANTPNYDEELRLRNNGNQPKGSDDNEDTTNIDPAEIERREKQRLIDEMKDTMCSAFRRLVRKPLNTIATFKSEFDSFISSRIANQLTIGGEQSK